MAFPTTGILDNFNRANEGPPPSSGWAADATVGTNQLTTSGNTLAAGTSNVFAYWAQSIFGPDSEVWVTLTTKSGGTNYLALYLRFDPATHNGYELELDPVVGGTDTSQHYRVDNAVFTAIGAAISQEFSNGDGLGLEVDGTTLQGYRRSGSTWAPLGTTRSDSTYKGIGRLAIQLGNTDVVCDDFGGGTKVPIQATMNSTLLNLVDFPKNILRKEIQQGRLI